MYLTIQTLLNDPEIVRAVIDRVQALRLDTIFWKKHLDFEETKSRVFKTYLGTVTGVTAGSVIDRNSNKPLRERKSLGSGYGEVAYMGDRYQMDIQYLKCGKIKCNTMRCLSKGIKENANLICLTVLCKYA